MTNKQQDRNNKLITIGILFLTGICIGLYSVFLLDMSFLDHMESFDIIFGAILFILSSVVSAYLHIIIHEAGHWIFGMFTDYSLVSLRFGKDVFLPKTKGKKSDGKNLEGKKLEHRKLHIAGTAGQCLMRYDNFEQAFTADGGEKQKVAPFYLYNLGGGIMNILFAFFALNYIRDFESFYPVYIPFITFAIIGLILGLTNLIPMNGIVPNDGYNILSMRKNVPAQKAFLLQLEANALSHEGLRLKEIPSSYFTNPPIRSDENPLLDYLYYLEHSLYLDKEDFAGANRYSDQVLAHVKGMPEVQRFALINDKIFSELMENPNFSADRYKDASYQTIEKQMASYLSVLRTNYALALLQNKGEKSAKELKEDMEKAFTDHPNEGEVRTEKALIEALEHRYRIATSVDVLAE